MSATASSCCGMAGRRRAPGQSGPLLAWCALVMSCAVVRPQAPPAHGRWHSPVHVVAERGQFRAARGVGSITVAAHGLVAGWPYLLEVFVDCGGRTFADAREYLNASASGSHAVTLTSPLSSRGEGPAEPCRTAASVWDMAQGLSGEDALIAAASATVPWDLITDEENEAQPQHEDVAQHERGTAAPDSDHQPRAAQSAQLDAGAGANAELHGENHPAVTIHFDRVPLVYSARDELRMELRFAVRGLLAGFTYLIVVKEEGNGKILQQQHKLVTWDAGRGDVYEAVFAMFVVGDSDAPRRFNVRVTDTFQLPAAAGARAAGSTGQRGIATHAGEGDGDDDGDAPEQEDPSLVAMMDRTVSLPGPLDDIAESTDLECDTALIADTTAGAGGGGGERGTAPVVTLASVASIDRFMVVLYSAAQWDGALSLAFYARTEHERELLRQWVRHTLEPFCVQQQQALRVTLLAECREPGASEVLLFPINTLRAAAMAAAPTDLVLYTDVDFIPSTGAAQAIAEYFHADAGRATRELLVLPCFWAVQGGDGDWPRPPHLAAAHRGAGEYHVRVEDLRRERLLAELTAGRVRLPWHPLHSHGATDYFRWLKAQDDQGRAHAPYGVQYSSWYEPYFALNVSAWRGLRGRRVFDERFKFGVGDKAQLSLEAAALGYAFVVDPSMYVIHVPEQASWECTRLCAQETRACRDQCAEAQASVLVTQEGLQQRKAQAGFTYYFRSALAHALLSLAPWDMARGGGGDVARRGGGGGRSGLQCFPARQEYHAMLSTREAGELMVSFLIHVEQGMENLEESLTAQLMTEGRWRAVYGSRFLEFIPSSQDVVLPAGEGGSGEGGWQAAEGGAEATDIDRWRACFGAQPLQGCLGKSSKSGGDVWLEVDRRLLEGYAPSVSVLGVHALSHELVTAEGARVSLDLEEEYGREEAVTHTEMAHKVTLRGTGWGGDLQGGGVVKCRLTTYVFLRPGGHSEDFKVDRALWLFPATHPACQSSATGAS